MTKMPLECAFIHGMPLGRAENRGTNKEGREGCFGNYAFQKWKI